MTDTRPTDRNIDNQKRDTKGRVVAATPMKPILDALNELLVSIRAMHPDVPNAVLVVGASSTKKYGHFAPERWDGKAGHEIMISGESLKRGAVDTLGTLLHECAHAMAKARGTKDTSRQGRYHNAQFKALATELGIEVRQLPSIGWSDTHVPEATQKLYRKELSTLRRALKTYRIPETGYVYKPKSTVKVWCDCRSVTLPIGFFNNGGIICELCGQSFEDTPHIGAPDPEVVKALEEIDMAEAS